MKNGIIVLGGHVQGLGILRILGREGVPGIVIENTRANLARQSKYCKGFFHVEDEALLNFLIEFGREKIYFKWILFPTNDFHVKLLSKNKQELEKNFIVSTDSWETVRLFYNKRSTYKLASSLNIPIASTYYPDNEIALNNLRIEYPCIIKPAVMYDFYRKAKRKVFVCHNLSELKASYRKALQIIPSDEIIVQEIIKGPSKNQFSAAFLFLNSRTYISLTACRMRQHPIDFGNATTYAETVDIPILKEYGEKILKTANYNGICEVEFKLDERDQQYKLLEVNPRTWKWHSIANKSGTPFLIEYYKYLTGNVIKPLEKFTKASFCHFLTDFPVQLQLFLKSLDYWHRKIKPIERAVWAKDDPKPWFYEKLYFPYYILNR